MFRHRFAVLLALALAALARSSDPDWLARGKGGMVASDSPEASQIGADVLAAGGNAFDAAVATSLGLTVARPQSTGLGGGGFLIAWLADEKRAVALDFREVAPAAATAERYAKLAAEAGVRPSPSIYGGNAIGVPGLPAGLAEIHKRFGTRPWAELVRPAAELAERGFTVDDAYRGACAEALEDYSKWPVLRERYPSLYRTLLGGGTPPAAGSRLPRPELARALRLIGEQGVEPFYRGEIGAAIARAAQAAGGVLTVDDLAAYRVREREPLWGGAPGLHKFVTMPPPSSGGVCLSEALRLRAVMTSRARPYPKEGLPLLLVECLKHAFADRARWLGDPDFGDIPVDRLLSHENIRQLSQRLGASHDPSEYGTPGWPTTLPDDRGTSHFSIVDRHGNVVALTETINGVFGSFVIAEPFGILLNNQMDDFTTEPGKPNLFGLVQGTANAVAPGKRPLSSMTPTIVLKTGYWDRSDPRKGVWREEPTPVLTLGASGGPRIITAVLQVMLNVTEREMPLEQAIEQPRLHHQWLPNELYFDRAPPAELAELFRSKGYVVSEQRRGAVVQAIQILEDGTLVGASDPRKGGRPVGVP